MSNDNKKEIKTYKTKITYTDTVVVEGATFATSETDAKEKLEKAFDKAPDFEVLSVDLMTEEEMEELEATMAGYADSSQEDEVLH